MLSLRLAYLELNSVHTELYYQLLPVSRDGGVDALVLPPSGDRRPSWGAVITARYT